MKYVTYLFLVLLALGNSISLFAQEEPYVPETDPLVLKKLDHWQDLKFGFLMHWGAYSQWGIVESWSICSEDVDWCRRPKGISYVGYVKKYEELPRTFDPVKFDPDRWAKAAKEAGMRYVVFTTKHHDGFCMFDTKYTDYKITSQDVPFHTNPKANVAKEVFNAFRQEGFLTGAYFSKPDWHSPDYWAPEWATPDRNNNYDTRKHPERWQRFKDFTYNQINELTSEYGPIDILWLDGGWVKARRDYSKAFVGSGMVPWPQDIDMPRIAAMARKNQPGIIIVDRDVPGPYENYRTPEQQVPDKPLPYPWETCMTMATSWSYVPGDIYKPSRQLIHLLVDIVAKGGNFLLNVGPSPEGELAPDAYQRMQDIGAWMKINSEAIYNTRPVSPYKEGKICFTSLKDGTVYAIYLADENETELPATIRLSGVAPAKGANLKLLGTDVPLHWKRDGNGAVINISEEARSRERGKFAWTIKISKIEKAGN
jgi:alpha-L-fucosidase